MRVLTLVKAGLNRQAIAEVERREREDRSPRITLFEKTLQSDFLEETFLQKVPGFRGWLYSRLPLWMAQVLEAYRQRKQYDVIISWAELLGIPFALLLKATGTRMPHVGIFSWISKPKKVRALRLAKSRFDHIVLMSSVQYDAAIHQAGMPPERVTLLRWPVDQKFWRPLPGLDDMISSVGREMRDYGTLVRALRDTPIKCHIAANVDPTKNDQWITDLKQEEPLPEWISIGRKDHVDLRTMYANSRFVVIPLFPTDTDNGCTAILEAMAMGKPVICSDVVGQRDVIQHGRTGLFVPPGDPDALRNAILDLWEHPQRAAEMGQQARAWIEQHHTLDWWLGEVKRIVESVTPQRNPRSIG